MPDDLPSEMEALPPRRKWAGYTLLGVAIALFCWFRWLLPLDAELLAKHSLQPDSIRAGLAVLVVAAFLWLTEAFPIALTALLIPLFAIFSVGAPVNAPPAPTTVSVVNASLAPFADPIIFLFFGGFVIAGALSIHGLDRWVAHRVVLAAKGRFTVAAIYLIIATAVISMWISNTATAAMMLPLGLGLAAQLDIAPDQRRRAEVFLLLGIAFAASVGGVGTKIGTPPNGITAKALNLDFIGWLKYGLPTFAVLLPAMLLVLLVSQRPSFKWRVQPSEDLWQWTTPRKLTLCVFLVAVGCWFASLPLSKALGVDKDFDTVVALAAVAALSLLRLITWKQIEKSVDWGVLLLFGGGLTLGKLLENTGTSVFLARLFAQSTQGWPLELLILMLVAGVVLLSEFASNTAVAVLMVPLFAKVAQEMGLHPAKLVIPVGLAASCGFMLPVATPPNALVYGTGRIPQRCMIRSGFLLDLACIALITLLGCFVF